MSMEDPAPAQSMRSTILWTLAALVVVAVIAYLAT